MPILQANWGLAGTFVPWVYSQWQVGKEMRTTRLNKLKVVVDGESKGTE